MKKIFLLGFIAAAFLLPSCKKDADTNINNNHGTTGTIGATGNTGNTGATGSTGTTGATGNVHTGLGTLVDPLAETYCVLIDVYGDTIIWQNTTDSISIHGGAEISFVSGKHPFMSSQFVSSTSKHGLKAFTILFQNMDTNCVLFPPCSDGAYLIPEGVVPIKESRLELTTIDDAGDWLNTNDANTGSTFEVISITHTTTSGCDKLRVKGKFTNTLMNLTNCVISCNVVKAEFVMDFQFNK